MAEFLNFSVRFESNQSGTVDRKHVGDPPGHEPTAARDVVSISFSQNEDAKGVHDQMQ